MHDYNEVRKLREAQQSAAVANVAALTAAASAAAPTKAEFDKVIVDLATLRTTQNALLTALRAARVTAS